MNWTFVLQLLQQFLHPERSTVTDAKFAQIDQEVLYQLLMEHRLILVAYSVLKNILPSDDAFLQKLQTQVLRYTVRHLQQQKILFEIAGVFREAKIRYVVLKGQPLNQLLYGEQCFRYSNDLDFLILPNDAAIVHQLLIAKGYSLVTQGLEGAIVNPNLLCKMHLKDVSYRDPLKTTVIEMHYRATMTPDMGIELSQVSQHAQIMIQNQSIEILPPEENFIYLALHGAKHYWLRLQWLLDLAVFQKKVALDWQKLYALAKACHCQRAIFEAKILLQECFNIQLPDFKVSRIDKLCVFFRLWYVRRQWRLGQCTDAWRAVWKGPLLDTLLYPLWRQKRFFIENHLLNNSYAEARTVMQKIMTKYLLWKRKL